VCPARLSSCFACACTSAQQDDLFESKFADASFDVVTDKGTLDAICLNSAMLDAPRHYAVAVSRVLAPAGKLIITSCNWTEDELKSLLAECTPSCSLL